MKPLRLLLALSALALPLALTSCPGNGIVLRAGYVDPESGVSIDLESAK